MIIEYKTSGNLIAEGTDWKLYGRDVHGRTLIIQELKAFIQDNKHLPFNTMKTAIPDKYDRKRSKSNSDIYVNESVIEMCKPKKTIPHLWIIKKPV